MDIRSLILNAFWLAFAPLLDGGALEGWTRADVPVLEAADAWPLKGTVPSSWLETADFDWRRPRDLVTGMVCDLGVMALALVDCEGWTAAGMTSPDLDDIRRRSMEARMRSI